MRFIFLLSVLFSLGVYAADLEIKPSSSMAVVVDTDSKSCYSQLSGGEGHDISAPHFSLPAIQFQWNRSERLTIHFVQFKMSGGSLLKSFVTVIGSDQLLYSFYGSSLSSENEVTMSATSTVSSQCAFKVGGIPIQDRLNDSNGIVRIYVYGTYQDQNGISVPISAEKEIDYFFKGIN